MPSTDGFATSVALGSWIQLDVSRGSRLPIGSPLSEKMRGGGGYRGRHKKAAKVAPTFVAVFVVDYA